MSLILDGSASVTINSGAVLGITSGTAVASTSGTSIDFTSIPSWVKRITIMFQGVSTNGVGNYLVQIGSGSVVSTGYVSGGARFGAGVFSAANNTSGFLLFVATAASIVNGTMTLNLVSSNLWVSSHSAGDSNGGTAFAYVGGGSVPALSGALDRVRITTTTGTDTFDAGTINILYE